MRYIFKCKDKIASYSGSSIKSSGSQLFLVCGSRYKIGGTPFSKKRDQNNKNMSVLQTFFDILRFGGRPRRIRRHNCAFVQNG